MVTITLRTLSAFGLIFCWLFSMPSYAANLIATVSTNQVTKAEVFQLRIIFDDKVDSDSLDLSVLETSFFLGQPSFGTSLNYVNGKRSSSSEWTIALKAKSLGTTTIPSFNVEGASSNPISIHVSQDTDLPNQDELAEIQSQLGKDTLYPNESTQLKTRLVIKANARRLQNVQIFPPKSASFTVEELGQANQYQSVINGIEATIVDQTFTITAKQAGIHTLSSLGFDATFVFGNNRTGTTKLLPVQINPEQFEITVNEQPQGSGGQWLPTQNLVLTQQWIDAQDNNIVENDQQIIVAVGDSITRELTLIVQGLKPEHFPTLASNYPESVRQYAEKPQFTSLKDGSTQMTIKQVLIAQHAGEVVLPSIDVEWFDTQSTSFRNSQAQGIKLKIERSNEVLNAPLSVPENPIAIDTNDVSNHWLYLTVLFATLWLITLGWHIKTRNTTFKGGSNQGKIDGEVKQILEALSASDNAKTQHLTGQWLAKNRNKNEQLAQEIESELKLMASAQYSNLNVDWNSKKLIHYIKKLNNFRSSNESSAKLSKL
ncbi:BatD family protein [Vibrio kasasachensis]|uniref:BatD family protein n=1 Tax=Vibrio kasasachensis TaxID=2910248 RepID=UPI003D0C742D